MRVAHFSDPHLLSLTGARLGDFLNKRWLGALNLLSNRSRHHKVEIFEALVEELNETCPEHVVATGDITNVAHDAEFQFSKKHFDCFKLGGNGVTVIPGNHDAYVAAGIDLFAKYFGGFATSDEPFKWDDDNPWPLVRVRDRVAVIGLSTSHPTPWFQAWGAVGDEQLKRLEQRLGDPRLAGCFRLVAIHHPPTGRPAENRVRGLRDHQAFAEVLGRAGAELVIHGHEHRDIRGSISGPEGQDIPVFGIQSATYDGGSLAKRARYRVFDIESGAEASARPTLRTHSLRVWNPEKNRFEDDPGD